jgi:hypothetical protein
MVRRMSSTPTDPGPGPSGLYDAARLAQRLGVAVKTLAGFRQRGVAWLPEPVDWLNGAPVWTPESLEGIEDRRPGPGRPKSTRAGDPS